MTSPTATSLLEEYELAVHTPATIKYDFRNDLLLLEKECSSFTRTSISGSGGGGSVEEEPIEMIEIPLLRENSIGKREGIEDAFVLSNLLSASECEELIAAAESDGIVPPSRAAGTPRTAKRTDQYHNQELSDRIAQRLKPLLAKRFAKTDADEDDSNSSWFGDFYGLHSNWRIVRYDKGDVFPAHQDQMDSMQKLDKTTGRKDFIVSTHTLLINLSKPVPAAAAKPEQQQYQVKELDQGGATRFYPNAKLGGTELGQYYEEAVDVWLPQGWAIAFPQMGLVHAGQPVTNQQGISKYVAQAGLLRTLPPGKLHRPSVFKTGPGIPRS